MKYARKAYDLRDRVSEKERLEIEAGYYLNYTAELEKAAEAYQQLQALYPRSGWYDNEIFIDGTLGNWDQALQLYQEQKRLRPDESPPDINITSVYLALNRFDEAGALLQRAHERGIMHQVVLGNRYLLAFLKGDTPQMQQAAAAAAGKPGAEDLLLMLQGETAAWFGRRREARLFAQHAMDVAQRNRATETATLYRAAAGLDEVMRGNYQQARTDVADALKLSATAETEEICALTLALAGDSAGAQELAAQLDEKHPLDTMVQKYWLPTIKGAVAMRKKDPALTVELLKAASPVELGAPSSVTVSLLPVFVRGEAYLALGQGYEATQEFQKFIDHRGLVANFPAGALARLGLARGLALEAGADPTAREKARSAFRDFLNLWQEADPDLPIYRQAKTEYAKLQ